MRIMAVAAACLALSGLAAATDVRAESRRPTSIADQALAPALEALAKDYGFQILYLSETVDARRTGGASGVLTRDEALRQLLAGTGLTYRYVDEHTITIVPVGPGSQNLGPADAVGAMPSVAGSAGWAPVLLAAAAQEPMPATPARIPDQGNAPAAEPGADLATLAQIVVTARKRLENLADVPVSISVITGEQLQMGAIRSLDGLSASVPGLQFSEAVSGNDLLFLRGIGSGVNPGFENSVGQVFDGFFFGRSRWGRSLFMDLQQVEVLKGPQGALIGKNTTAGVINIRSARPSRQFEGYLLPTWQIEGDEGYAVEGAVSGPVSESVRARMAIRWEDKDGYYTNLVTDQGEMIVDAIYARGTIEMDITPSLTATLLYQYGDQERHGRNREIASCPAAITAQLASYNDDCTFNYTNSAVDVRNGVLTDSVTNTRTDLVGLTFDWATGIGTLTSLTGYARYATTDRWDGDGIKPEGNPSDLDETHSQWSQEIRLVSDTDGPLDYIAGLYYQSTEQDTSFTVNYNFAGPLPLLPVLPPPLRATQHRVARQETETFAGFAQLTWSVSPRWDLTAGFRATREKKQAHHLEFPTALFADTPIAPPPGGPAANIHDLSADRTESQVTPNFTVQWRPAEGAMLYASVSRGFKGGGFDLFLTAPQAAAPGRFEFEDEKVLAYEIGAKLSPLAAGCN